MTRKFVKRSIFFIPIDLIIVTDSLNFVLMTFSGVYVARKSLYETAVHHLEYEPVNLTWGGLGGLTPKPKNQLPQRSQTFALSKSSDDCASTFCSTIDYVHDAWCMISH